MADDISKCIILKERIRSVNPISVEYIHKGTTDDKQSSVQAIA